jgi:hypothetical protein
MLSEASCVHSAVSGGSGLLGFEAVSLSDWFPAFRKSVVTTTPRDEGSAVSADSELLGFDAV